MKIKEKQPFFRVIFSQKKGFFILKYAFVVDAPKTPETLVNKGPLGFCSLFKLGSAAAKLNGID